MQELIKEYLVDEALMVIPVLIFLGKIIKDTPKVKDWVIPYVLLVLGIAITLGLLGLNIDAVIQGVLVTGASVLGHQAFKQIKRKDDK